MKFSQYVSDNLQTKPLGQLLGYKDVLHKRNIDFISQSVEAKKIGLLSIPTYKQRRTSVIKIRVLVNGVTLTVN